MIVVNELAFWYFSGRHLLSQYKDRRCVTEHECQTMPRTREDMMGTLRLRPWKAFNGSCITDCPSGYEEIAIPEGESENKIYKCQECKGKGKKLETRCFDWYT